jgi:hypothetical protein
VTPTKKHFFSLEEFPQVVVDTEFIFCSLPKTLHISTVVGLNLPLRQGDEPLGNQLLILNSACSSEVYQPHSWE